MNYWDLDNESRMAARLRLEAAGAGDIKPSFGRGGTRVSVLRPVDLSPAAFEAALRDAGFRSVAAPFTFPACNGEPKRYRFNYDQQRSASAEVSEHWTIELGGSA